MLVATYNAASIRPRVDLITEWLAVNEPDILAIQETKCEDEKFPVEPFEELGYCVTLNGQKAWNGVALLSREPAQSVIRGFDDPLMPEDARILTARIGGLTVINTYVPNGSSVGSDKFEYKLRWLERFAAFLQERFNPSEPLIWLGDINIAPTRDDVYNPNRFYGKVGFHPEEIKRLEHIKSWGLTDLFRQLHHGSGYFTYWDFVILTSVEKNFGWRIDHIYGTAPVASALKRCWIDKEARIQTKPSDHTFVIAELDM